MTRAPNLQKGDTVGMVAASSPVCVGKLDAAISAVENFGLQVKLGKSVFLKRGYLAGDDITRAGDINNMFADESIKGIFNIRGGYGAQRILPLLDYGLIISNPKVFAGYSDTTSLHIALIQLCGFVTYHSPMPSTEL